MPISLILGLIFGVLSLVFLIMLLVKKILKHSGVVNFMRERHRQSQELAIALLRDQFVIQLTPGKEVQIDNWSGTAARLVKILLGLRIANPTEYPVLVESVRWELWLGPVVKNFSSEPAIELKAHKEVADYVFQDVITEQDFLELAQLNKENRPSGYLEGVVFCRTDFGRFEKKFSGFNLDYHLQGSIATVMPAAPKESSSELDSLTGFFQRKFIELHFQEIIDSVTQRAPVSFMMVDIDHFKTFNDTHGHLIGDEILKVVCEKIREVLRDKGIVVRYGGDEFSIILEGMDSDIAERIAQELHRKVGECRLRTPSGELSITLSIGVAVLRQQADYKELIKLADKALYESKRKGRNQVTVDHGRRGLDRSR